MEEDGIFTPLPMSVMSLAKKSDRHYKVYKNPQEFVLVEAEMAYEAIEKSGISHPYKVEHLLYGVEGIKNPEELTLHDSHTLTATPSPIPPDAQEPPAQESIPVPNSVDEAEKPSLAEPPLPETPSDNPSDTIEPQ